MCLLTVLEAGKSKLKSCRQTDAVHWPEPASWLAKCYLLAVSLMWQKKKKDGPLSGVAFYKGIDSIVQAPHSWSHLLLLPKALFPKYHHNGGWALTYECGGDPDIQSINTGSLPLPWLAATVSVDAETRRWWYNQCAFIVGGLCGAFYQFFFSGHWAYTIKS